MATFETGSDGKKYRWEDRNGTWVEATEAELRELDRGTIGQLAMSALDATTDMASMGMDFQNPASLYKRFVQGEETLGQKITGYNDERQAAAYAAAPIASTVGSFLTPDMLIGAGAVGKGAKMASRFRKTADDVVDVSRNRSLSAAANPDASDMRLVNQGDTYLSPQQMRELGAPLTKGDEAFLSARTSDDIARADTIRYQDELSRSTPAGIIGGNAGQAIDVASDVFGLNRVNAARNAQEDAFTRFVGNELGDPNATRLDRGRRAAIRDEVQKVFKDTLDNNPNPVRADGALAEMDEILNAVKPDAQIRAKHYIDRLKDAAADGVFDKTSMSTARNEMTKEIDTMFSQGNYEGGQALAGVRDALDDAIEASLDMEQAADLKTARRRWRILKVLETVGAKDRSGQLNPLSFQSAYERVTPAFRRAARPSTDFEKGIDTFAFLAQKPMGNSGTADRLMGMLRNPAAQAQIGAVGAGYLGLNSIFGN